MAMSLAIITFIAVILLAIIVKINFADTEVSVPSRIIISSVILLLFASGIYYLVTPDHVESSSQVSATPTPVSKADTAVQQKNETIKNNPPINRARQRNKDIPAVTARPPKAVVTQNTSIIAARPGTTNNTSEEVINTAKGNGKYKVLSRAYFHNQPDESTRRRAFITHWNNAIITALNEQDGFIYVIFSNHLGQTSKGWLAKTDLRLIGD